MRKAEELAGVESFYTAGNMEWPHLIDNALKAHHLYHKDKQYAVMRHPETNEMCIIIIDEFTGRLMMGRQWSDGLHQAVEAKHAREGVKIKEETQTLATVTLQNFFKLYTKISGMTGTAMTEAAEFGSIYKLEVIAIPTNKPLIRVNSPDVIYRTEKEKWTAVVEEIERIHKWDILYLKDSTEVVGSIKADRQDNYEVQLPSSSKRETVAKDKVKRIEMKGRPMLIGTTDVDKSIKLSEMLKRRGIKHELLNALPEHAAREAEIVAQAGRIGAVTIATNMAGRGTDIILGGNPETMAWARLKDQYATAPRRSRGRVEDDSSTRSRRKREDEGGGPQGRRDGRPAHRRHRTPRVAPHRQPVARPRRPAGRSGLEPLLSVAARRPDAHLRRRMGVRPARTARHDTKARRSKAAWSPAASRPPRKRSRNAISTAARTCSNTTRSWTRSARRSTASGRTSSTTPTARSSSCEMLDKQIDRAAKRSLTRTTARPASPISPPTASASSSTRRTSTAAPTKKPSGQPTKRPLATSRPRAWRPSTRTWAATTRSEWNWQALAKSRATRAGASRPRIATSRRSARTALSEYLTKEAEKSIDAVDLSDGKDFLDADWGQRSLCDWARLQFQIKISLEEVTSKSEAEVKALLSEKIRALYRQGDRVSGDGRDGSLHERSHRRAKCPDGQRYNRDGLLAWATERFPDARPGSPKRSSAPSRGTRSCETLLDDQPARSIRKKTRPRSTTNSTTPSAAPRCPRRATPTNWPSGPDANSSWIPEAELTGVTREVARQILWNAFDIKYRPEMRGMERSLLLNNLDTHWKNHLYTMDHLRSGVGLRGYAQEDPKIVYKQEGMKEFASCGTGSKTRSRETIFRMEETEAFQESRLDDHVDRPRGGPESTTAKTPPQLSTNGATADKKPEPIRNRGDKVGRNDPCPCGSGKKYKNCHMRQAV